MCNGPVVIDCKVDGGGEVGAIRRPQQVVPFDEVARGVFRWRVGAAREQLCPCPRVARAVLILIHREVRRAVLFQTAEHAVARRGGGC